MHYEGLILSYVQEVDRVKYDYNFREELKRRRNRINIYSGKLYHNDFHDNRYLMDEDNLETLLNLVKVVYGKQRILFCVDIEAYEFDHDLITEIGISIYDPRLNYRNSGFDDNEIIKIHIIIEENEHICNGRYVADNKQNFLGGPSLVMPMIRAQEFLETIVLHYFPENIKATSSSRFGVSLVGHSIDNDLAWLNKLGIYFPDYVYRRKYMILDTYDIWTASFGSKYGSLTKLLCFLGIPNAFLHNGGNDSFFTILLLMVLCDPNIRECMLLDRINRNHLPDSAFAQLRKKGCHEFRFFSENNYLDNTSFEYCICNEAECDEWTDFKNHNIDRTRHHLLISDYVSDGFISRKNISGNLRTDDVGFAIEFTLEAIFKYKHY